MPTTTPSTLVQIPDAPPADPRQGRGVVVVLAFAGIVVSLMQSLIIPIVPELPRLLGATASDTTWAITATLLAGAIATPTVGRLGDMFGKRRMLLLSIGVLIVGSIVGALATTLVPLIIGRALQGLAAGVIPLGISIMRDEVPPARLGGATAAMSASLGVGGALGLPAAALIADRLDWHILFWTAAVLGAVALSLVLAVVPESPLRTGGRFDWVGALGLSAALAALLLAVSKGADWGWGGAPTIALFAAAAIILTGWGVWELRTRSPLVDLRVSSRPALLLTNGASVVFGFAIFAMSLVLPQLLQAPASTGYGLGQSMLVVGLVMAPSGLVMMAVAPLSARISRTAGPKTSLMLGALTVAVGYGVTVVLMDATWQILIASSIVGVGVGLAYGAMPALVMGAVPREETAAANSLNTLMRSIGTTVSSAVAGLVLSHMTTTVGGHTIPTQDAFRLVLGLAAVAALIALVVAAFLPRRDRVAS